MAGSAQAIALHQKKPALSVSDPDVTQDHTIPG